MARPPLPSGWRDRFVGGMRGRCIGKVEDQGANRGQLCDYVTHRDGGTPPEFWCCHLVAVTAADVLGHASPIILSGSCQQQWDRAIAKGARRTRKEFDTARAADPVSVAGWLFLCIALVDDEKGGKVRHAHHIGSVGDVDDLTGQLKVFGPHGGFLTCEGNAADPKDPASRNGDGAYHGRERGHSADTGDYEFIDLAGFPL